MSKLSFVAFPVWIKHHPISHLSLFEFAFERTPRTVGVNTRIFFVILPDSLEFVSIGITIKSLAFSLSFNNMSLVVLTITKLNLSFTLHQILSEEAFISSGVRPTVLACPVLDGVVERSFEIVSILIKYLTPALNMIGNPISFYFRTISEVNCSKAMLFPI